MSPLSQDGFACIQLMLRANEALHAALLYIANRYATFNGSNTNKGASTGEFIRRVA